MLDQFGPFSAGQRLEYEEIKGGIRVCNETDVCEIPEVLVNRKRPLSDGHVVQVGDEVERTTDLLRDYGIDVR